MIKDLVERGISEWAPHGLYLGAGLQREKPKKMLIECSTQVLGSSVSTAQLMSSIVADTLSKMFHFSTVEDQTVDRCSQVCDSGSKVDFV